MHDPVDPDTRQLLLEMVYGLLTDQEAAEVRSRFDSDAEFAALMPRPAKPPICSSKPPSCDRLRSNCGGPKNRWRCPLSARSRQNRSAFGRLFAVAPRSRREPSGPVGPIGRSECRPRSF